MRGGKLFVLSVIFLLLIIPIAFAGITGSTITGSITDQGGIETASETSRGEEISEDKSEIFEELEEEYKDEKIVDPGLTPDSPLYFVDEFFDRFGDDIENKEEKVAEIEAMIKEGNIEAAREAKKKYEVYAEEIEKEADPEKRGETRRSAVAIKNALEKIDVSDEEKEEFVDEIIEKESNIVTSVDISNKIRELCVELAELDPVQYKSTCKTDEIAPEWKKRLDKDLTEEQKKEAKKFGEIMSECFKTSGRECNCDDISFYDFSVACSKIAPLATKCDAGSEEACKMMDEVEMPDLPDYLQDIFDEIGMKYGEAKYDMYMPPECIEAGATIPKECAKIMIKIHAPPECRDALLEADIENEREGREICDKIMFEKHAPKECIDKGITNPEECAKYMESKGPIPMGGEMGKGPSGFGPPGQECMKISDSNERLKCFENAVGNMGERYGIGEKYKQAEGQITWQCKENRIHWPPDCDKFMREEWPIIEGQREQEQKQKWKEREEYYEQRPIEEYYRPPQGEDYRRPPEGEYQPPQGEGYRPPPEGEYQPPQGEGYGPGPGQAGPPEGGEYQPPQEPPISSGGETTTTGGGGGETPSSSGEVATTGGVIKNKFLEYYDRK